MMMFLLGILTVIVALAYPMRLRWHMHRHRLTHQAANARTAAELTTMLALTLVAGVIISSMLIGGPL
jgi:hypothetical protein